jgi:hypothetical protein
MTDVVRSSLRSGAILSKIEIATRNKVDRQQLIERENLLSDILKYLDNNQLSETGLSELIGDTIDKRGLKELEDLFGANNLRISDIQSQVEAKLTDLLADES